VALSTADPVASPNEAEAMAVAFARVLRGVGIVAPVDSVVAFVDALHRLGIGDRGNVYWAGRATLVRRPEEFDAFDRAFAVFCAGRRWKRCGQRTSRSIPTTSCILPGN
jgi:uncharacterized protein with von Willebrand factor type A (vWA) domain